jgi:hypothetical protein
MFHYSRRDSATLQGSAEIQTDKTSSVAPDWAKETVGDSTSIIAQINIASACPYCTNYNLGKHLCDLYDEPIPQDPHFTNPCKGNTFNRKQYSGNRLAQLRKLREIEKNK